MFFGLSREAFVRAWRQMYGLPSNWTDLPPMPTDGGTWSALHCWALPTSSFVELVIFARMFVDALDFQNYEEHHDHEHCCFARSKREVILTIQNNPMEAIASFHDPHSEDT
jgi:hypothetical protein